jgi:hypothetical protein
MARVKRMGEAYSAGDVTVSVAGFHDVDPSNIEYSSKFAHEVERGLKREGRAWRMGAEELSLKITFPKDVIQQFVKKAPKGKLAYIKPFPVNVIFANSENDLIHDVIWAKFTGNYVNVTGDGSLEEEHEMFATDMSFNVGL